MNIQKYCIFKNYIYIVYGGMYTVYAGMYANVCE